jgi:ornithine carbamoyltransferase
MKDFLSIADYSPEEIQDLLDLAVELKKEITDEVADGPSSMIFVQAHNRMHAQKAIVARLLSAA